MPRSTILYIAVSLDGYIAKPNNDLSFLDMVQKEGEDYGYFDFLKSVDVVIAGRKTYDWVVSQIGEYPRRDKICYILTRTERQPHKNIMFYNKNLTELIHELKQQEGKDIFIEGGADIVHELLKDQLIDEFNISIIPILTGNGIKLFRDGYPEQKLKLIGSKQFETGLMQLHYHLAK